MIKTVVGSAWMLTLITALILAVNGGGDVVEKLGFSLLALGAVYAFAVWATPNRNSQERVCVVTESSKRQLEQERI